jgi:hypothetical protein
VIIKHLVELETVINEESPEPTVKSILRMSDKERNEFFQMAGTEMIADLITKNNLNEGSSWAVLRVASKETI